MKQKSHMFQSVLYGKSTHTQSKKYSAVYLTTGKFNIKRRVTLPATREKKTNLTNEKRVYGKQLNLHNDTYWSIFFVSALSPSFRLVSIFFPVPIFVFLFFCWCYFFFSLDCAAHFVTVKYFVSCMYMRARGKFTFHLISG